MPKVENVSVCPCGCCSEQVPREMLEKIGARLLHQLGRWANILKVPVFDITEHDMGRAASLLVATAGRATSEERVCATLGWMIVQANREGVTPRELLAMFEDAATMFEATKVFGVPENGGTH
jgi:hypothetical protein